MLDSDNNRIITDLDLLPGDWRGMGNFLTNVMRDVSITRLCTEIWGFR